MRLILTYIKINYLQIIRNRSAAFFNILFPGILFILFGHQAAHSTIAKDGDFIVFCNYAVQTTLFSSLGMSIAENRSSDWTIYLKTLPSRAFQQFSGLIVSKILLAFISLIIMIVLGYLFLGAGLPFHMLLWAIFVALVGSIPLAFLAVGLGYRINPEASRGLFVFLNLLLLFGAFSFPETGFLSVVRNFVPSYQWMMATLSHVIPGANVLTPWYWLLGYTVVFYLFAQWSYSAKRNLRKA